MRHAGRVGRVQRVDVHRKIDRRRQVEPKFLAAATGLDNLDAETLELVAVMIVDGAKPHLNQTIGKLLFHDPGKRRGVGSRVTLVCVVDIGVRIDMKNGQAGVTATYGAHDRMRDRVVAAEANQRIPGIHGAPHILLDEIPRIRAAIELDVALIDKSAGGTEIDARFAPHAVGVGDQFAPDMRGCFRRAFHE